MLGRSPGPPAPLGKVAWVGLAGVAITGVLAVYVQTLHYGFRYDDYHVIRPWTLVEVQRVLHGTWDPTRIEVPFYRPLTAWWYALRFELFGLNAVPQHALSLVGMVICAMLTGLFVWREIRSRRAAMLATMLYAIHPGMPYAQGVWLTNQMHLMASFVVILALLAWQRARARDSRPWVWGLVFGLQTAAFGIKEDTVMLVPLLLGLTGLRALLVRDIGWPHWTVLAVGAAFPFGLFAFRYDVLGRIGGYGAWPSADRAWTNLGRAFELFTLSPPKRPWQGPAGITSRSLLVVGGLCSLFRREALYLFLVGIFTAAAFNLPFALVSKVEQYHLVTLGAVIALVGAAEGIIGLLPGTIAPMAATALVAVPLLSFVPLTRHVVQDFAPCAPYTLTTDEIVTGWGVVVVPTEIQAWLRAKPGSCATGGATPITHTVSTATWALGSEVDEHGDVFQWTSGRSVVMVRAAAARLTVALRRPRGIRREAGGRHDPGSGDHVNRAVHHRRMARRGGRARADSWEPAARHASRRPDRVPDVRACAARPRQQRSKKAWRSAQDRRGGLKQRIWVGSGVPPDTPSERSAQRRLCGGAPTVNGGSDRVHLRIRQARVQRQRADFIAHAVGDGARLSREAAERRLARNRHRKMDDRSDPVRLQVLHERRAMGREYREEMVDVPPVDLRRHRHRRAGQRFSVPRANHPPSRRPLGEPGQTRPQDGRLHLIKAAVHAELGVVIPVGLSTVAQSPQLGGRAPRRS